MSGIGQFTYVLNGDSRLPYGEDDAWGRLSSNTLGAPRVSGPPGPTRGHRRVPLRGHAPARLASGRTSEAAPQRPDRRDQDRTTPGPVFADLRYSPSTPVLNRSGGGGEDFAVARGGHAGAMRGADTDGREHVDRSRDESERGRGRRPQSGLEGKEPSL